MSSKRKHDSDEEFTLESPKKRSRTPKTKLPKTKAEVTIRATDISPDKADSHARLAAIDVAVIGRIRKALALASHAGTGEQEAKAALRMASKLLDQYNVSQADIIAHETDAEKLQRAGQSVVSIRSTVASHKPVDKFTWARTLSHAMTKFFGGKSYSTRFRLGARPRVEFTFYGLAEQTVAAAHAFEMTYNLISTWSLHPDIKGVNVRNCYCSGVAQGLIKMASEEKKRDEQRAAKKEQALLEARAAEEAEEAKSRLNRLQDPPVKIEEDAEEHVPGADHRAKVEEVEDEDMLDRKPLNNPVPRNLGVDDAFDDDDDDDDDDAPPPAVYGTADTDFDAADDVENLIDLDAEMEKSRNAERNRSLAMPPPPFMPKQEEDIVPKKEEDEEESPWSSVQQLVQYREMSTAIGEEYLKKQGIKLGKGKKKPRLEFKDDRAAESFAQGKKDARKIDVRQRQIKDAEAD
ncbi:DUF2786 domain-containing protein [Mycena kentingensis (nom. inval.)]|nr:DUF2786 domain-containing protein [Mycena kentingensis (nom. inval.)]